MSLILVLVLGGLMHAARSFSVGDAPTSAGTALSFGYLLLTAFFVGGLFKRCRLPRLTGYIITGIVVGPGCLGLVSEVAVENLTLVTGVAVALIALTAGTELELGSMRPLLRSIAWVTLIAIGGTTLLLGVAVFLARDLLPFMAGMSLSQCVAVSVVLGVVMVAQSPAVVVAIRNEMAADGPVARTVLGIVVIADLVVILFFALVSSIAKSMFGEAPSVQSTVGMLAWEIVGSLVAGVLIGLILSIYLRKIRGGAPLFVVTVCFVVAEVGRRLHFDPLLVALAAGIFIRNATSAGSQLHREIEASALPVYVVFFAVAGATIHLDVLAVVGVPAALFVVVRAAGFLVGARIGARLAGAPDVVRRHLGFGLLPQAGLALALAMLFAKTFPEFGAQAGALTLGVVAINEIVAPALYRFALVRSGEAGAQEPGGQERDTMSQLRQEIHPASGEAPAVDAAGSG